MLLRRSAEGSPPGLFCIGQQVWENQFDDDSSFMPTSVSVEEVV